MADAKPQTIKLDPKDPNYVEQIKELQALAAQPLTKTLTTQKAVEANQKAADVNAEELAKLNEKLKADQPTWLVLVQDLLPLIQQVLTAILDHQKTQTEEAKKQTAKLGDIAFDVRRQAQLQRRLHGLE